MLSKKTTENAYQKRKKSHKKSLIIFVSFMIRLNLAESCLFIPTLTTLLANIFHWQNLIRFAQIYRINYKAYDQKLLTNHKKIDNIKSLLRHLPADKMSFYDGIIHWPVTEAERHCEEDF